MLDKLLSLNLSPAVKALWERRIRRGAWWALVILLGILTLEVAFHLWAAPNLRIQKIVFDGPSPIGDLELMKLLGLRPREYYFSIDEQDLEKRLSQLPWVRKASLQKTFPDTLKVSLSLREPLALGLASVQNRSAVLLIDSEGVVYDIRPTANNWDLPVVSGVVFESLQPGLRFPGVLKPLFKGLETLKKESPALFRMISEVEIRKNSRGSYDAVFCPLDMNVRLILGDDWSPQALRQAFILLDTVRRQGWTSKTKEIDFRSTPVVFRPRES